MIRWVFKSPTSRTRPVTSSWRAKRSGAQRLCRTAAIVVAPLLFTSCAAERAAPRATVAPVPSAGGSSGTQRVFVSDPDALQSLTAPLNARAALLEVRNLKEWRMLERATTKLGPPPDFHRGIVLGIVADLGTPLRAEWPISIDAVRPLGLDAMLCTSLRADSYLPDGAMFVEFVHIPGLRGRVRVVELDNERYLVNTR